MGQATLSVRMEEDIKKKFDSFCADVGMNATVAINMFARAVLRERRLPFEVTTKVPTTVSDKASLLLPPTIDTVNWKMDREERNAR